MARKARDRTAYRAFLQAELKQVLRVRKIEPVNSLPHGLLAITDFSLRIRRSRMSLEASEEANPNLRDLLSEIFNRDDSRVDRGDEEQQSLKSCW